MHRDRGNLGLGNQSIQILFVNHGQSVALGLWCCPYLWSPVSSFTHCICGILKSHLTSFSASEPWISIFSSLVPNSQLQLPSWIKVEILSLPSDCWPVTIALHPMGLSSWHSSWLSTSQWSKRERKSKSHCVFLTSEVSGCKRKVLKCVLSIRGFKK